MLGLLVVLVVLVVLVIKHISCSVDVGVLFAPQLGKTLGIRTYEYPYSSASDSVTLQLPVQLLHLRHTLSSPYFAWDICFVLT